MSFHVIIPARYASTRLPNKVLLDLAGKPMLQHVYERVLSSNPTSVVIATDDACIQQVAEKFGAKVCMTQISHQSGTERLAEVIGSADYKENDIIVNVQADEPLMPAAAIHQVAKNLQENSVAAAATLCEKIFDIDELFNPNVVKVVMDGQGFALYFSRAPIPWDRASFMKNKKKLMPYAPFYRHIGLYAYRVSTIKQYVEWPSCYLEKVENLEQLRILWNGGRIHVDLTEQSIPPGIDTQADLDAVREILK